MRNSGITVFTDAKRRELLFTRNTKREVMSIWEGELPQPAVRTVEDMRRVLADPSCESSGSLYFMYRDLAKSDADWNWLYHNHLRYDITVIPPGSICGELVKTKGHYHPKNPAGIEYPEIYEVVEGQAHYLLQTRHVDDVVMVSADAGDLIIIPPGYGHVSINPSPDTTLVMANIVSRAFESEYEPYEKYRGGAYYEMSDGRLLKNPRYPDLAPVRYTGATCTGEIHPFCRGPLYKLIGNGERLSFLNFPEKYLPVFSVLLKD
jgi:glucose-6-phosphate isomerase